MAFLSRNIASKTFWTTLIGLIGSIGMWATGEATIMQVWQPALVFLGIMFGRDTIAKNK